MYRGEHSETVLLENNHNHGCSSSTSHYPMLIIFLWHPALCVLFQILKHCIIRYVTIFITYDKLV